jgi:hypothetical protein
LPVDSQLISSLFDKDSKQGYTQIPACEIALKQ